MQEISSQIPPEIAKVTSALEEAGFEAFLVGGCTRDLLRNAKPKDWDITTNAKPDQILALFGNDEAFYENNFGTVTVKNEEAEDSSLRNVEITPYRLESTYSDNRRPDEVSFSETIDEDLKRRDFTINAIAYSPALDKLVDLFDGIKDIKDKSIRAVGDADERFQEDALRMMRAIRLSSELGFTISRETSEAINSNAELINKIAVERVQVEFSRIISSPEPMVGISVTQKLGLLQYILPEIEEGINCEHGKGFIHKYDVYEHNLRSLQHAADKDWSFHVKLAALLHDVGKPRSRRRHETKDQWTFYGHDVVSAKMAKNILNRLKFSRETVEVVSTLIRNHMFFSDTDTLTLSAVRRIINKVGVDHIWDLMNLRICDRVGTGRPKEEPYRLRKYYSMIEEALRDPISVGMLKITGDKIMDISRETPGPKIGYTLHALLEEVLDDPSKNTQEHLENRALELLKLPVTELKALGEAGKEAKDEAEDSEVKDLRSKHHVK